MSKYAPLIGPLRYSKIGKWAYSASGFNKYGLYQDDCLNEDVDIDVKLAVERLPRKLYDERNFRIFRALDLSMKKIVLPEVHWTEYEKDVKYLQPYLKEIVAERREREELNESLFSERFYNLFK